MLTLTFFFAFSFNNNLSWLKQRMDAAAPSGSSSPSTDVQQHYSSDATDKSASDRAENQESEAQTHHHHQMRSGRRRTGDVDDQNEFLSQEEEEVPAGRDQGQDHNQRASFSGLLLGKQVVRGLEEAGYLRPSPIQAKAIPLGRCGLGLYSFHSPLSWQDAIAFVQM